MRYVCCCAFGRPSWLTAVGLVLAAALPCAAEPVNEVYTYAGARANGESGRSISVPHPQHSEDAARATDPAGSPAPTAFAEARGSADSGGPFRVFATVGGDAGNGTAFTPALEAESQASQLTDY